MISCEWVQRLTSGTSHFSGITGPLCALMIFSPLFLKHSAGRCTGTISQTLANYRTETTPICISQLSGFNYAFFSKVVLIMAAQVRCQWNVNGALSTTAVLLCWEKCSLSKWTVS